MLADDDLLGGVSADDAFNMLQELEQNTPEEIRRQRSHFRVILKAKVILLPGNASETLKFKVQGVTGDLSEGGCKALVPVPLAVGDIYRLQFDRATLDLPLTFARCIRCALLRENSFEVGFRFFTPITLPRNVRPADGNGARAGKLTN